MANKVLSIEIGYSITKLCLMEYRAKNPKVYRYTRIPTPRGILQDGELQATEAFAEELREAIKKNRMRCKQVIFSVTSSKIASREVTIPFVKESRIDSVLRTNIADYFPIDPEMYELGHIILGTMGGEGKINKYRLMVLAAPKTLIEGYRKLAVLCGMTLAALDYSGNSIYQLVRNDCKDGVQMIVKVDEQSAMLTILKEQSIVLQRSVAYGVNMALETIQENPVFGAEDYLDAMELARRQVCMSLSLRDRDSMEVEDLDEDREAWARDEDAGQLAAAKKSVTEQLEMLVNGIARVMDYYSSRNSGEKVDRVYLTGLGAEFLGLHKLLGNELGAHVQVLDSLESFRIDRYFKEGRFGEYISCVGATIAPVGFISTGKQLKGLHKGLYSQDMASLSFILLGGGLLLAIAFLGVSMFALAEQQMEYDMNVQRMDSLKEAQEVYLRYTGTLSTYEDVKELYSFTESHNEFLLDFLSEMEEKMPSSIQIVTFNSGPENVIMNMKVQNKMEMANALQQLRTFESLSGVELTGAQEDLEEDGPRKLTFSVTCTYRTGETAAEGAETDPDQSGTLDVTEEVQQDIEAIDSNRR